MTERPAVPASMQRQLMIDAGWKCSVPTCGTNSALEIDHIDDWADVREHAYENLIVLCPTHHAMKRKGSNPREINATALRVIKQNQLDLAGRYADVERRVLEHFVRNPDRNVVFLPGDFDILLMHLIDAGIIEKSFREDGSVVMRHSDDGGDPTPDNSLTVRQAYRLTASGEETVSALRQARRLASPIN